MKKTPLFISGVLTTFVLVVMAGVITAFRSIPSASAVAATPQPTPVEATATAVPTLISPQDAAQIAARILGRTDLFAVESTTLNAADAYKVTFSSGDVVYISLTGEVLQVVSAPSNSLRASPPSASHSSYEGDEHPGGDD